MPRDFGSQHRLDVTDREGRQVNRGESPLSRLAAGERFDPAAERLLEVAEVLDRIYGR